MSTLERYGGRAVTTATWVLVAMIGFLLVTEHLAHLFGILPWLILLACPVMHFFMHGQHHGHHHQDTPHPAAQDPAGANALGREGASAHEDHGRQS